MVCPQSTYGAILILWAHLSAAQVLLDANEEVFYLLVLRFQNSLIKFYCFDVQLVILQNVLGKFLLFSHN